MDLSPENLLRNDASATEVFAETEAVALRVAEEAREHAHKNEFFVIVPTRANATERQLVANNFMDQGWHKVTPRTSAENGERPGLTSYTFQRNPDDPPQDTGGERRDQKVLVVMHNTPDGRELHCIYDYEANVDTIRESLSHDYGWSDQEIDERFEFDYHKVYTTVV